MSNGSSGGNGGGGRSGGGGGGGGQEIDAGGILPQEKFAQETGNDWVDESLSGMRNDYDKENYEVKVLDLDDVKPSQFGEDYINASSQYQAQVYKEYMEGKRDVDSLRKNDFYPIVVDKNTLTILDGNHRHAVHSMLGIKKIKVILVEKKKK